MHFRSLLLSILLTGCATSIAEPTQCESCNAVRKAADAVIHDPTNNAALDAYIATLVETPKGSGYFAVEGDLRMTREQIRADLGKTQGESNAQVAAGGGFNSEVQHLLM